MRVQILVDRKKRRQLTFGRFLDGILGAHGAGDQCAQRGQENFHAPSITAKLSRAKEQIT